MASSLLDLLEAMHRDAARVRNEREAERRRYRGRSGLPRQSSGVPESGLSEHHVALDAGDLPSEPSP